MNLKNPIIKGALILTAAGVVSRLAGFFYRIFLSRTLGDSQMGLYQLSFTIAGFCYAFCCGGISTAISRYVAQYPSDRRRTLAVGFLFSFVLSVPASILIYVNASWLSTFILHEPDCASLIRYLAFSIPFTAVHGCINGYYLGQKKASLPAVSQLIEQFTKIICVYCIWKVQSQNRLPLTPTHAMLGSLVSELISVLVMFIFMKLEPKNPARTPVLSRRQTARNIFGMAMPLTLNRVILTFLQSAEATLIPFMLCVYGMTKDSALATFGVLTGMAFPFVLFPQSVIQAISSMLLPEVAGARSSQHQLHLQNTVARTLSFSLLIGILCTGVFTTYGHLFGAAIFHNERVGYFIIVLSWLCPFLYANNTLASTLNGLGKTGITFTFSMISTGIKIAFILFLIPRFGILAYLWGMLAGTVPETFLLYRAVKKETGLSISVYQTVIRPIYAMLLAIGIAYFADFCLLSRLPLSGFPEDLICCVLIAAVYLAAAGSGLRKQPAAESAGNSPDNA